MRVLEMELVRVVLFLKVGSSADQARRRALANHSLTKIPVVRTTLSDALTLWHHYVQSSERTTAENICGLKFERKSISKATLGSVSLPSAHKTSFDNL